MPFLRPYTRVLLRVVNHRVSVLFYNATRAPVNGPIVMIIECSKYRRWVCPYVVHRKLIMKSFIDKRRDDIWNGVGGRRWSWPACALKNSKPSTATDV